MPRFLQQAVGGRCGRRKIARASRREVAAQTSVGIDEVRNAFRRQHGRAIDEHQVQADAERRQAARASDGVADCNAAHHQTRGRQDALRVREFDGLIDLGRRAEIVGRDDECFQCTASRRSRRKWKNSMPSRRRRFIISGLLTISPTIEAILPVRK